MENIGTFLGKWVIGKQLAGGVLLHLNAMVSVAPFQKISGHVTVTQATHPPLHVVVDVAGHYFDTTVGGTKVHVAIIRNVPSPLDGAPWLEMLVVWNEDWQSGTAWFSVQIGSSHFEESDAPVKVEK
jgi:hypothetical protein